MIPLNKTDVQLTELLRYLVRHRPDEHWSFLMTARGEILGQRWPYRVPTSVYLAMKEDAGLAHDA